jgi:hypothetical protein
MFIPKVLLLELLLVVLIVQILEYVFEATVVFFKDGIFCGEVQWVIPLE